MNHEWIWENSSPGNRREFPARWAMLQGATLRYLVPLLLSVQGQKGIGSLNDPCDCMQHHDFWVASRRGLMDIFWAPDYPLRALDPEDHLHFSTRRQSCLYSPENEESHRPTALSDCIPGFILVHIVCMQRHLANRNPERAMDFATELVRLLPFGASCIDKAGWPITSAQILGYYRRFRRAFCSRAIFFTRQTGHVGTRSIRYTEGDGFRSWISRYWSVAQLVVAGDAVAGTGHGRVSWFRIIQMLWDSRSMTPVIQNLPLPSPTLQFGIWSCWILWLVIVMMVTRAGRVWRGPAAAASISDVWGSCTVDWKPTAGWGSNWERSQTCVKTWEELEIKLCGLTMIMGH